MEIKITIQDSAGSTVTLGEDEVIELQRILNRIIAQPQTYPNITNHDWQEKALENMRKDAEAYNAANAVVKAADCSTDCYPCQSKKDTEAKIAEESPKRCANPGCDDYHLCDTCIVHWAGQCNATYYPDVHS